MTVKATRTRPNSWQVECDECGGYADHLSMGLARAIAREHDCLRPCMALQYTKDGRRVGASYQGGYVPGFRSS